MYNNKEDINPNNAQDGVHTYLARFYNFTICFQFQIVISVF